MKIIKKNQLTILVLALMLVTAGYLNYTTNVKEASSQEIASIGDATLVSSNLSNSLNLAEENTNVANEDKEKENENKLNTTVETNSEINDSKENENKEDYFTSSRLERETMYSQMIESYQKILDSTTTTTKQKEAAQEEINSINKNKNAIMISENIIKTKGFEDVVIFVNDNSINAVIKKEELKKEDTAQIQSVIAREMNAKIDEIHIMNK